MLLVIVVVLGEYHRCNYCRYFASRDRISGGLRDSSAAEDGSLKRETFLKDKSDKLFTFEASSQRVITS